MNPTVIPYQPNRPASAEVFVGRTDLLRMAAGLQTAGIGFSVVGKPGMGKTSLLNAISRSLLTYGQQAAVSPIPLPIYIECLRRHRTLPELQQEIVQQTLKAISTQHKLDCPLEIQSSAQTLAQQGRDLETIFKGILNWAFEQQKRILLPVFLFDDLHRLCARGYLGELASLLQTPVNQQQIALVLAGRDALTEELRNDVSPLRRLITQNCELKPLDLPETQALVTKAREFDWPIEAGFCDRIYHLTQGHPYRLHYYLYRVLSTERALTIQGLEALNTLEHRNYLDKILGSLAIEPGEHQLHPVRVFISYSHQDEDLRQELTSHLTGLQNVGVIELWSDRNISAGTEWEQQIAQELEQAHIILLLVSSDFIASSYCYSIEMQRALERHQNQEARTIPVIIRDCDWQVPPLKELQAIPRDNKAVATWGNKRERDTPWRQVAGEIRKIARDMQAGLSPERYRLGHV